MEVKGDFGCWGGGEGRKGEKGGREGLIKWCMGKF